MKKLLIILALALVSFGTYAQNDSIEIDSNKVTFTQAEVIELNNYIMELQDSVDQLMEIVNAQDIHIEKLEAQVDADSVKTSFVYMELEAVRTVSDINYNLYKTVKPKWHEKRWVGFVGGVLTVLGGSIIVKNTMQTGN